jgi:hypothetical protein
MKWFKNFFRKETVEPAFNIYHPDIADQIELAFEAGGKKFYRFADQYKMPTGRYKFIVAATREVDLRMSIERLSQFMQDLKNCLKGEKGKVDLETAWKTIFAIETRIALQFEPHTVKKLASICYFTDSEILTTWDKVKDGSEKVKLWDKHNCLDFFLTRPISELLRLSDYSLTSLETYLSQVYPILEELNSVHPTQSSEPS